MGRTLTDPRTRILECKAEGCWIWDGGTSSTGYGQIYLGRENGRLIYTSVHRLSYELFVEPIPDGLVIDHLCRNKLCVNPDHLETVTQWTNIIRGEGVAAKNVRKTTCAEGHPYNAIASNGGRYCKECHNKVMSEWGKTRPPRKDRIRAHTS